MSTNYSAHPNHPCERMGGHDWSGDSDPGWNCCRRCGVDMLTWITDESWITDSVTGATPTIASR